MMQKIDMKQWQRDVDSRQLTVSEPEPRKIELTERQLEVTEDTWQTLTDIYGSSLVSQYGEVMPEAWVLLLKGITPRQIHDALNKLAERKSGFPPNGAEFRQLCLPETISPSGGNSAAYINFKDPRHPNYEKPVSMALEYQDKRKAAGRAALASMMGMLPDKIIDDEESDNG